MRTLKQTLVTGHERAAQLLGTVLLVVPLAMLTAACFDDDEAAPSPAPTPTASATGIAELDAVIDEVERRDVAALRERLEFQTIACTTELGAGGPPKCAERETEGSEVDAFFFLGCAPEWHRRDTVDALLEMAVEHSPARYAAFAGAFPAPADHPLTGQGAVLVFDGPDLRVGEPPWRRGMALWVDDGRIIAMVLACGAGAGAESLLPVGRTDFLLEPPPRIAVEPSAGRCENELGVAGEGFEPGARVTLVEQSGSDDFATLDQAEADASGGVRFSLKPFPTGPGCEDIVIFRVQLDDEGVLLPAYASYAVDE